MVKDVADTKSKADSSTKSKVKRKRARKQRGNRKRAKNVKTEYDDDDDDDDEDDEDFEGFPPTPPPAPVAKGKKNSRRGRKKSTRRTVDPTNVVKCEQVDEEGKLSKSNWNPMLSFLLFVICKDGICTMMHSYTYNLLLVLFSNCNTIFIFILPCYRCFSLEFEFL